jgi:hypothetical protein
MFLFKKKSALDELIALDEGDRKKMHELEQKRSKLMPQWNEAQAECEDLLHRIDLAGRMFAEEDRSLHAEKLPALRGRIEQLRAKYAEACAARDVVLASVDSEIRTVKQSIGNRISDIGGGLVSWVDAVIQGNKLDAALKARLQAERGKIQGLHTLREIVELASGLAQFVESFETDGRPLTLYRLDDFLFRKAPAPEAELTPAEKSMLSELAPPVIGQKPKPII